jgi:hypothetical protein
LKFPDLETQLKGRDLALLRALRHAAAAGKTNADADDAFDSIRRAIENLEHRILRDSKRRGHVVYINRAEEEQKECVNRVETEQEQRERMANEQRAAAQELLYIALLVRIAAYRQGKLGGARLSEQEAIRRAEEDFPFDEGKGEIIENSDRRPAEIRAIEIIQGSKVKAKKNPIEMAAIELTKAAIERKNEVKRKGGRRAGRRDNIVFDAKNFEHDLKLTVIEVIEAVLPFIEQLAPNSSSKPDSLMIAAVCKAVRSAGLKCEPELATDMVRKLRSRGRRKALK